MSKPATIQSPTTANMVIDGREVLNFGGASYLGLAGHPRLLKAGAEGVRRYGSTAQLPRHYNLALQPNLDAEQAGKEYFDSEASIYFCSGYFFGLIALPALTDDYDIAILDASAHYNLADGARAAGKPVITFDHLCVEDLAKTIDHVVAQGLKPLVATDGMFATNGNIPPLAEYFELIESANGWLVIDESHSFGCIGETGRGAAENEGVRGNRVLIGGSMAKSFGAHGGMAFGSKTVIDKMWKTPAARGAVSGTSAGAAMTAESFRLIRSDPKLLATLRKNQLYLKRGLKQLGLDVVENCSPIASFSHRDSTSMSEIQAQLWDRGIFIIYSNYVGAGAEGVLRIAAFSDHKQSDFDRLLDELKSCI